MENSTSGLFASSMLGASAAGNDSSTAATLWETAVSVAFYIATAFLGYLMLALAYIAPPPSLWIKAFQIRNTKLNERIPFMMWIPPVGDFIEQSKDYLGFYARRAAMGDKYGGFINWTMRHLLVAVHNPETARKFLAMDDLTFARDFSIFYVVDQMAGKSILTSDGEDWRVQHRILYKAFSSENLVAFRPAFEHRANVMVKKLASFAESGEVVDIQPVLGDATLGVIMDCAFGDSLSSKDRAELVDIFKYIVLETTNFLHQLPIINRLPGAGRYKLQRKLKRFRAIADRAITYRKTGQVATDDDEEEEDDDDKPDVHVNKVLIDLMLEAAKEDPTFDDEKVRDNVLLFLSAGSETTATTMLWALYLLSQNPEVYDKVMEENRRLDLDSLLLPGDLSRRVPYLTRVIKETLRVRTPTGGVVARMCREDTQVGELFLPKGTGFTASSYDLHHHPSYWDHPEEFNPDRFLSDRPNPAYIPFGAGRRYCIGRFMALGEMQVILSNVLRQLRFEYAGTPDDARVIFRPPLAQPNRGMKMRVHRVSHKPPPAPAEAAAATAHTATTSSSS